jgi:hypothetical protein
MTAQCTTEPAILTAGPVLDRLSWSAPRMTVTQTSTQTGTMNCSHAIAPYTSPALCAAFTTEAALLCVTDASAPMPRTVSSAWITQVLIQTGFASARKGLPVRFVMKYCTRLSAIAHVGLV